MVFSLIGDLFSVKQRANVAAGVQVATGIGFAAGQAIAGFVGRVLYLASLCISPTESARCIDVACTTPHPADLLHTAIPNVQLAVRSGPSYCKCSAIDGQSEAL